MEREIPLAVEPIGNLVLPTLTASVVPGMHVIRHVGWWSLLILTVAAAIMTFGASTVVLDGGIAIEGFLTPVQRLTAPGEEHSERAARASMGNVGTQWQLNAMLRNTEATRIRVGDEVTVRISVGKGPEAPDIRGHVRWFTLLHQSGTDTLSTPRPVEIGIAIDGILSNEQATHVSSERRPAHATIGSAPVSALSLAYRMVIVRVGGRE